ncbi:uncharacterized protein LOC133793470 [Humulus lupulus]|uniref:uncharacterized protein LOC133793470 n=1 Tax=Humulus lupulus TaxID=3486 RepID=UPI002B405B56|nr:uncharacterized protein LOC133793470 [Humulus lupulus]
MDSDLDSIIDGADAKRSKRPRAGAHKADQLGKGPKRSKKTPPLVLPVSSSVVASTAQASASTMAPSSQIVASAVAPTSLVDPSAMAEAQPPVVGQSSSAPLSKRPSVSRVQKLSISTHIDAYAVDNAAGSHGSTLISDVMSRIGQSYGSFEAPQWQCLTGTRDCTALYEKSIEHTAAALAFTAQLNYQLNHEIHSGKIHAQEAKDLHLKASDDLKAANVKLDAGVKEREGMATELGKLRAELEEQKKEKKKLASLLNTKRRKNKQLILLCTGCGPTMRIWTPAS